MWCKKCNRETEEKKCFFITATSRARALSVPRVLWGYRAAPPTAFGIKHFYLPGCFWKGKDTLWVFPFKIFVGGDRRSPSFSISFP